MPSETESYEKGLFQLSPHRSSGNGIGDVSDLVVETGERWRGGGNLWQSVTGTWRALRNLQGSLLLSQMKHDADEGIPVVIPNHKDARLVPCRLNQIPSQNVRGAYNKVRVSSGQCKVLGK